MSILPDCEALIQIKAGSSSNASVQNVANKLQETGNLAGIYYNLSEV